MLSLDEAIAHERDIAAIQRNNDKLNKTLGANSPYCKTDCLKCAEEHEQLAEWLEELKEYRKHIELTEIPEQYKLGFQDGIVNGFENGYNKAIDDFAEKLKAEYKPCEKTDEEIYKKVCIRIEKIAEQLKEGGENERNTFQSKTD